MKKVLIFLFLFGPLTLLSAANGLIPLTVLCTIEGAEVYANNSKLGVIEKGQFTRDIAPSSRLKLKVTAEGYYDFEEELMFIEPAEIKVELQKGYPVERAMKYTFAGGTMFSVYYRFYPQPNRLFIDAGLGATLQSVEGFYLEAFLQFDAGYYFLNELSRIRPYAGLSLNLPVYSYINLSNGLKKHIIIGWQSDTFAFQDSATIAGAIDFSLLGGCDFSLSQDFYLGLEAGLLLVLKDPSKYNTGLQFGLNAVMQIPPDMEESK